MGQTWFWRVGYCSSGAPRWLYFILSSLRDDLFVLSSYSHRGCFRASQQISCSALSWQQETDYLSIRLLGQGATV